MADEGRDYKIALAGSLPGEQANGWDDDDFAAVLDGNRAKVRYARIAYNVLHSKEVTATGKRILTIQLQRIEPVSDEKAADDEQDLTEMFTARTGQATLFANTDE